MVQIVSVVVKLNKFSSCRLLIQSASFLTDGFMRVNWMICIMR